MKLNEIWKLALVAYDRRNYEEMAVHASELIAAGAPWDAQGYHLRGLANELRCDGPGERLDAAISDYRQAAVLVPHPVSYQCLARALMKAGHSRYDEAYRFLLEGSKLELTPELLLGFGHYYSTQASPDLEKALAFFRRAAYRGRFRGFVAAAQLYRRTGSHVKAFAWDLARIVLSPVIWLLQGRHALFEF